MKRFLTFMIFFWHGFLFVAEADLTLVQFKNFVDQLPEEDFEQQVVIKLFRMPLQEVQKIYDLWGPLLDCQTFFDTRQLFTVNYMCKMLQVEQEFEKLKDERKVRLNIKQEMEHATEKSTDFFCSERKTRMVKLVKARLRLLEELENNL
jgi:hypothetical protein